MILPNHFLQLHTGTSIFSFQLFRHLVPLHILAVSLSGMFVVLTSVSQAFLLSAYRIHLPHLRQVPTNLRLWTFCADPWDYGREAFSFSLLSLSCHHSHFLCLTSKQLSYSLHLSHLALTETLSYPHITLSYSSHVHLLLFALSSCLNSWHTYKLIRAVASALICFLVIWLAPSVSTSCLSCNRTPIAPSA